MLALGASVAVVEAVPKDWCQYICPNNEMVPEVHNECVPCVPHEARNRRETTTDNVASSRRACAGE